MIRFDQDVCSDLEQAQSLEWLETNGLGGFSSSTITGLNTRRYHGLLTAATKPPVGRFVLLSKVEETLLIDGHRYDLSSNQYPGAVHPQGHRYLAEFRLDPFPTSVFRVEGIETVRDFQCQFVRTKTDATFREGKLMMCPSGSGEYSEVDLAPEETPSIVPGTVSLSVV